MLRAAAVPEPEGQSVLLCAAQVCAREQHPECQHHVSEDAHQGNEERLRRWKRDKDAGGTGRGTSRDLADLFLRDACGGTAGTQCCVFLIDAFQGNFPRALWCRWTSNIAEQQKIANVIAILGLQIPYIRADIPILILFRALGFVVGSETMAFPSLLIMRRSSLPCWEGLLSSLIVLQRKKFGIMLSGSAAHDAPINCWSQPLMLILIS